MGQMIKITYVGAFIIPLIDDFQRTKSEDNFYNEFCETGMFRTAYQGLENIDVLIPCGNDFALKDQENYYDEFVLEDFYSLKELENNLSIKYHSVILKLKELYPNGSFRVTSGIISYWDEIA